METEYEITVVETQETKSFPTLSEVRQWADQVRQTLEVWGSEPTFKVIKHTREAVIL